MPDFDYIGHLLSTKGEPQDAKRVSSAEASHYVGRVPNALIDFWTIHGRGSYMDGFYWICDPAPFQPILETVFAGDPVFKASNMTAISYNAFGELNVWDQINKKVTLFFLLSQVFSPSNYMDQTTNKPFNDNLLIQSLLTDFVDSDTLQFEEAKIRLGRLKDGEIYTYAPVLQLGGSDDAENARKVKIIEHLAFIAELEPFSVTRLTPPSPPQFPYGRLEVVRKIGEQAN